MVPLLVGGWGDPDTEYVADVLHRADNSASSLHPILISVIDPVFLLAILSVRVMHSLPGCCASQIFDNETVKPRIFSQNPTGTRWYALYLARLIVLGYLVIKLKKIAVKIFGCNFGKLSRKFYL